MATFYGKKNPNEPMEENRPLPDTEPLPKQENVTLNPFQEQKPESTITNNVGNMFPVGNEVAPLKRQTVLTDEDVDRAVQILRKYKSGKANLDNRIVEDELWWQLRHWEMLGREKHKRGDTTPDVTSAWLFNALLNKHADAMDNIPAPVVLPRERMDEESAKTLTEVLPVIMEYNDYEKVYSSNWWEKLKHGSAVYSIVWDTDKENGLGDIAITQVDLLNLYYEPGITDLQQSRNVFITKLVDIDTMKKLYPDKADSFRGDSIDVKDYLYDDTVDNTDKVVVVDWYYKTINDNGKKTLQYAKFCGGVLLYASENEPEYQDRGYYDHGLYPFVIDSMFPEKGTPIGFGYISICKDPQIYIDKLSSNIMQSSLMGTKRRYFVSNSTAINEEEFADWSKPFVHVEGEINESRIQEMAHRPVDGIYYNVLTQKIDEMKETSSNRDVNSGGSASGITAASAIAALQEAGNKVSRDMIAQSYRAYQDIVSMVIELIRQFYDEKRAFRVTGKMVDQYEFVELSNQELMEQQMGFASNGSPLYRRPVFDLKVKAQKRNPFNKMEENERAKELYSMGFFAADNAQAAMGALEMMDFEGIDKVKDYVSQGQTLMNIVQQQQMQIAQLTQLVGAVAGIDTTGMGVPVGTPGDERQKSTNPSSGNNSASGEIMESRSPKAAYAQRLAKRSKPDANTTSDRAMPN